MPDAHDSMVNRKEKKKEFKQPFWTDYISIEIIKGILHFYRFQLKWIQMFYAYNVIIIRHVYSLYVLEKKKRKTKK